MGFVHDRPQGWVEESWKLLVYCSVYRLEVRRFAQTTEEQKRESERLLNSLLLMFESYEHYEVGEVLRDICVHYDEMFVYPNGRTDVPLHVICEEVEEELRFRAQTGSLVIYEDNDRWWERLPPPEVTTPPRRDPPRVIPPPREPPPPVEKTWFSAQFVDESGLWIDGLAVKMKVGGTSHALMTDKAGVAELRQQTHSTAVVSVADIPQAEKILIDRLERMDEAPAPTGPDVIGYPVAEPAKNVALAPETPKLIVLGLAPWVGIKLKDQDGNPVTDAAWAVVASDASSHEGTLNTEGKAWVLALAKGPCEVGFPDIDAKEWGATNQDNPEGEVYTVQPGDHISQISERAGFQCDDTIWMHPKNAKLRASRDNPHVLREGDELFIPTKRTMTVKRTTRVNHEFVLNRTPLTIWVRLLDFLGDPIENASGTLEHSGGSMDVTTDGDGILEADIPRGTMRVVVRMEAPQLEVELGVGELDPPEQARGSTDRLNNLSYKAGEYLDESDQETMADMSHALELFQDDSGEEADGELTDTWKQRLKSEHGC